MEDINKSSFIGYDYHLTHNYILIMLIYVCMEYLYCEPHAKALWSKGKNPP